MGGSRIFDWGGPRIDEARDAGQNVAIFALKSWPIGGGHGPVAPPLEPPMGVLTDCLEKKYCWLAVRLFVYVMGC